MSGKRAKPSPWRFLRAAPVVVLAVVWVMVGFFLLLPGSGTDQAHDWGVNPIPSTSDEGPSDGDSLPASTPEPSTPGTAAPRHSTTAPEGDPSPTQAPAPGLELSGASASGPPPQPAPQPAPRTASDPTSPAPAQPGSGPGDDNPGKKKGHDKPHGPPGDKP